MIIRKEILVSTFLFIMACTGFNFPMDSIVETDFPKEATTFQLEETIIPTLGSIVDDGDILFSIYQQGGLCQYGLCNREIIIFVDATFLINDGNGEKREGIVGAKKVEEIWLAMVEADFDLIRAIPFTDECPTAYDGTESIYTFYINGGVEIISSCEYVIDENSSLFAAIFDLMAGLEN